MITAADTVVDHVGAKFQRLMVEQVQYICEASPLVRPRTPGGMPMRVRVTAAGALGWVGSGGYYYSRRGRRGQPWPAIPPLWCDIANDVAGVHPWDCAIINWYDADAALGWHVDKAERNRMLPIVTISLGDAARWAVRPDYETAPSRCTLNSGDITLLAGTTRNWLHSIERIIPAPLLSPLGSQRGRISITMRVAG